MDLVEPSAHLLAEAKRKLSTPGQGAVGRAVGFHQVGLQDFHFSQPRCCRHCSAAIKDDRRLNRDSGRRYSVVWVQWALLYLTDGALLALPSALSARLLLVETC